MILWVAFLCFAELSLTYFFPLSDSDWYVWKRYYIAKDAAYDFMFVLSSWLVFSLAKDKPLLKACAAFALILAAGSFADKVIFKLNQYLLSDVLLIVLGLLASWRIYRVEHGRNKKLGS